jgi:hypothetical protein
VKGIIKYLEQFFAEAQARRQFWKFHASVAELVYALALGASGAIHESSSLSARTNTKTDQPCVDLFLYPFSIDTIEIMSYISPSHLLRGGRKI